MKQRISALAQVLVLSNANQARPAAPAAKPAKKVAQTPAAEFVGAFAHLLPGSKPAASTERLPFTTDMSRHARGAASVTMVQRPQLVQTEEAKSRATAEFILRAAAKGRGQIVDKPEMQTDEERRSQATADQMIAIYRKLRGISE